MSAAEDLPFATKGIVYLGAKEHFAAVVPGGHDAILEAMPTDDLRDFYQQMFIAVGWYDLQNIVPITRAAAQACGQSTQTLVVETSRYIANRDIRGVLRLLLRLASPEMVARRLPKASMRYFNFGSASGELAGDKKLEAQQTGIPRPLATWMASVVETFSVVALELAGASLPVVSSKLVNAPDARTTTIDYEIHWQ